MLPQLEEIAAQLRAASGRARAVVALAGEARLTQRPAPGKWSVGECLTHLRVSSELYFQVWPSVLASARQQDVRGNGPFKMDFWGKILTWALEPPPRIRLRAPAVSRPPAELGPAERILPAFLESQDRLLATIGDADGLPIDRIKIASPFDGRVRYSVWSSFCVTAAHHRRP